ncbi:MAG TPA: hypothetical protein PLQ83_18660, partial [Thermoflexales bacterium]|nr:hypothetical protein [Thermoflexales bacterium]
SAKEQQIVPGEIVDGPDEVCSKVVPVFNDAADVSVDSKASLERCQRQLWRPIRCHERVRQVMKRALPESGKENGA